MQSKYVKKFLLVYGAISRHMEHTCRIVDMEIRNYTPNCLFTVSKDPVTSRYSRFVQQTPKDYLHKHSKFKVCKLPHLTNLSQ